MPRGARHLRSWALRVLGLALVATVLATQVRSADRLERADGSVLEGRVVREASGDWRVEPSDGGAPVVVPDLEVPRRGEGPSAVPAVTFGLRTLWGRLGARPGLVLLVLGLLFTTYLVTSWRWRLLLAAADVRLSLGEATRLNLIGAFFNVAVPGSTGGDVVKAWLAARTTGRGVRSLLSVLVDRVVGLLGLAVFAVLALLLAPPLPGYGPARAIAIVALAGLLVGLGVFLSPRLRRLLGVGWVVRRTALARLAGEASAALRLYRERPVAILVALGVSLLNHGLAAVAVWLVAKALGIGGVSLPTALALVPVANLFGAIPLLPGGWGVGEVGFAYLFGAVGVPPTEAVGLSVVYRLGMLVASLPGGVLWLRGRERPSQAAIATEVTAAAEAAGVLGGAPTGPVAAGR